MPDSVEYLIEQRAWHDEYENMIAEAMQYPTVKYKKVCVWACAVWCTPEELKEYDFMDAHYDLHDVPEGWGDELISEWVRSLCFEEKTDDIDKVLSPVPADYN